MVVIGLILIVGCVTVGIGVGPAGIVASPVAFHVGARGIVPSVIGLLCSVKRNQLQHRVLTEVACLQEVGVQSGRGTADIAVAADVRHTAL